MGAVVVSFVFFFKGLEMINAPVYAHDDVFAHPDLLVSLEDAGLEEFNSDTVKGAIEGYYSDEDANDSWWH